MYRGAVRSILSELVRQGRLKVMDAFSLDTPKTRELAAKLKGIGHEKALVVTDEVNVNLLIASRNLPGVAVCDVGAVDPVSLVAFESVLFTRSALQQLQGRVA
jgi:large subunit ribosomal protein L4